MKLDLGDRLKLNGVNGVIGVIWGQMPEELRNFYYSLVWDSEGWPPVIVYNMVLFEVLLHRRMVQGGN